MTEAKDSAKKLLLDLSLGRYDLVTLAHEWMTVLQRSEESKDMSQSEIVKRALEDVTSGTVKKEDIAKAKAKLKAAAEESAEAPKEKVALDEKAKK